VALVVRISSSSSNIGSGSSNITSSNSAKVLMETTLEEMFLPFQRGQKLERDESPLVHGLIASGC